MPRTQKEKPLTPLELQIMQALWELNTATVQQVQEHLTPQAKLAYTTVQTMMTVLHRKGKVTRKLLGKAYEYAPSVSQRSASTAAVRDVVRRFFDGSAQELVMSLVQSKDLTPEKLAQLARELEEQEDER
jgi:BlaI family transcriptional regulator, penicillinase repressor